MTAAQQKTISSLLGSTKTVITSLNEINVPNENSSAFQVLHSASRFTLYLSQLHLRFISVASATTNAFILKVSPHPPSHTVFSVRHLHPANRQLLQNNTEHRRTQGSPQYGPSCLCSLVPAEDGTFKNTSPIKVLFLKRVLDLRL